MGSGEAACPFWSQRSALLGQRRSACCRRVQDDAGVDGYLTTQPNAVVDLLRTIRNGMDVSVRGRFAANVPLRCNAACDAIHGAR